MNQNDEAVRPNIVLLFSDQHRHDVLGCAGHPVVVTPNIDRLASNGVRFSAAYCQSPVCQPSRASLITGRYAHQTGITRNFNQDLDPTWDTMMKRLQAKGYVTASIGKTHYYTPKELSPDGAGAGEAERPFDLRSYEELVRSFGWDHVLEEFDRYVHALDWVSTPYTEFLSERGHLEDYRSHIRSVWRLTPHHWDGVTSPLPQEEDLTCFLADHAISWLERHDGAPFLLKVAMVQPHVPLMDDPIWARHYEGADVPLGPRTRPEPPNDTWGRYLEELRKHSNSHLLTDEYVREGARHYFGMISLIDQRIGDIVRAVVDRGWADNTWFIYTSDHGEMLGDHNLMAKMCFYRSSVRSPLIVTPPAGSSSRVVDEPVELVDVSATVLDLAGAGPLGEGQSLRPAVEGRPVGREVAFSAIQSREADGAYFVSAATERLRATFERNSGVPCELFDLETDPAEEHNLVGERGCEPLIEQMRTKYVEPHLALR